MAPALFVPTAAPGLRSSTFTRPGSCKLVSVKPAAACPTRSATVRAAAEPTATQLAWVDGLSVSETEPGRAYRRVLAGLDLCFACDEGGEVYCIANKGPPLGVPLSDGTVMMVDGVSCLRCPQYGSLFQLADGQVKEGSWLASPPVISNLLRVLFAEPIGVLTYPVREMNGMLQACVNINARSEYEEKYWKGILDASGKADGGYF